MLRMSVAAEEYVMIGDDIRLVFLGGHGKSYAHHDRCAQGVEHRQEQGAGEKDTGFEHLFPAFSSIFTQLYPPGSPV